jgi:hypothetical protein
MPETTNYLNPNLMLDEESSSDFMKTFDVMVDAGKSQISLGKVAFLVPCPKPFLVRPTRILCQAGFHDFRLATRIDFKSLWKTAGLSAVMEVCDRCGKIHRHEVLPLLSHHDDEYQIKDRKFLGTFR